jgi:hypothetical protein
MASITHRILVVDIDDKNPTEEQLLAAVAKKEDVQFAFKMLPAHAERLGMKDKGLVRVIVDQVHPEGRSHTGGYLITGRYYFREQTSPIVVKGYYNARKPVSGHFDLTRNGV